MSKLLFKKGTQLYSLFQFSIDASPILMPILNTKLEEDFECERPEKDYAINIAGQHEIEVSEETKIHYKDKLYLKCGDASNFNDNIINKTKNNARSILNKIGDFFYEEEPAKKHLEEDENGNMVEVENEPKRSINWFRVGMCSTSVTLMIIGAIIMAIKKHM